ncbi:MAG: hypothetical protein Q9223_005108, partial [Gallowayella weberi]
MADQGFKDKCQWLIDWAYRNAIPEFKKKLFKQVAEDANYEPPSDELRQQLDELVAQARSVDQQLKRKKLEQAKLQNSPPSPSRPSRLLNLTEFQLKQEKEAEKVAQQEAENLKLEQARIAQQKKRALDTRQKKFAEINQMQAAF